METTNNNTTNYKNFEEGVEVKVDEAYLNDEASPEGATETATVQFQPSDDEELVCIVYKDGSMDYVPQDVLEIRIICNQMQNYTYSKI